MELLLLALLAFASSTLTATIGIGGGVLLISIMPGLVPSSAIVPLHGAVQLASNASRATLVLRSVQVRSVALYAVGALLGAGLGSPLATRLPAERLPLVLGVFVLFATWAPVLGRLPRLPGDFLVLGAVQTAISMFVGAAGPLAAPLLLRSGLSREKLVATHAGLMTVMHGLKTLAFGFMGFAYGAWLKPLGAMVAAVIVGSWCGTRLRAHVPEERFRKIFRWVVTLLALRMIFGIAV